MFTQSANQGIILLGLGPGDPGLLTREAWQVLAEAREIYLRTMRHPAVVGLPAHLGVHAFDELYDRHTTFPEVYAAIAEQVLELGRRPGGVIYAVPGHPLVAEASVQRILHLAAEQAVPVRVVAGVSFLEPVLTYLKLDPLDRGLQVFDAMEIGAQHHPPLDPDRPVLIAQLYGRLLAADVKLTLLNLYPAEHPLTLIQGAGTAGEKGWSVPLCELDWDSSWNDLTTLYVPPLPRPSGMAALQEIVAHLRAPDGCPWDREQTHATLRRHLLEETYEVLDAIDADDRDKLCEELGDLLLQVLLHTQIAVESGEFSIADVAAGLIDKLIRRHPHVFGDLYVADAREVLQNWEQLKAKERGEKDTIKGPFAGVPVALPALLRAQEVQDRAARLGVDGSSQVELERQIGAALQQASATTDPERRVVAIGEALFTLVRLTRMLNVEAESALRQATARFVAEFPANP